MKTPNPLTIQSFNSNETMISYYLCCDLLLSVSFLDWLFSPCLAENSQDGSTILNGLPFFLNFHAPLHLSISKLRRNSSALSYYFPLGTRYIPRRKPLIVIDIVLPRFIRHHSYTKLSDLLLRREVRRF